MHAALSVRPQGCIPKRAGEEIFPQAFQERRAAFGVANEIALVREIRFVRVLFQQRRQREARLDSEAAALVEERQRIGRFESRQR